MSPNPKVVLSIENKKKVNKYLNDKNSKTYMQVVSKDKIMIEGILSLAELKELVALMESFT